MANAGFDVSDAPPPPGKPSSQDVANSTRFFDHELRPTTRYIPDISALTASPARVLVGIGVDSGRLTEVLAATASTTPTRLSRSAGDRP